MSIRILVADDHKIMREGLRSLIEQQDDMEIVAEAENGQEALEAARLLLPDVVIMDIAMPLMTGIDATRQLSKENRAIKIIALSMYSDKRFMQEMFNAGAKGYLLKDCAFEEVVQSIRTVTAGKTYVSLDLAGILVKDFLCTGEEEHAGRRLAPREQEILKLIAEGKSTKEIAQFLEISVKTVETHRGRIMDKIDIHTIPELTKYAIREGLTSL